jgi:major membrane immunogen (membrane-anchored lipoprotein)
MARKGFIVLWILLAALPALSGVSCSKNSSSIKDGYYTAVAVEFDSHGWKEYVTIYVSSGRIVTVEYNAFNPSGFIKSWDMDYMRVMNAQDGIYPNAYTRIYAGEFLASQGTEGVDRISGASNSYHAFLQLADAAVENARQGNTEIRLVNIDEAGEDNDSPAILH